MRGRGFFLEKNLLPYNKYKCAHIQSLQSLRFFKQFRKKSLLLIVKHMRLSASADPAEDGRQKMFFLTDINNAANTNLLCFNWLMAVPNGKAVSFSDSVQHFHNDTA